jgi:hypothetical protein
VVLVGKALQFAALLILPIAMFLEISNTLGRNFYLADMLMILIFGMVMFGTGRLFEGYGQPRS